MNSDVRGMLLKGAGAAAGALLVGLVIWVTQAIRASEIEKIVSRIQEDASHRYVSSERFTNAIGRIESSVNQLTSALARYKADHEREHQDELVVHDKWVSERTEVLRSEIRLVSTKVDGVARQVDALVARP